MTSSKSSDPWAKNNMGWEPHPGFFYFMSPWEAQMDRLMTGLVSKEVVWMCNPNNDTNNDVFLTPDFGKETNTIILAYVCQQDFYLL